MDGTQVMVYFNLSGDEFPVEVVSERLQVDPTKSYKKGEIIRKTNETENITRNYTSWQLSTGYQESFDVGDVMEQLILKLKDKSAIINELKDGHTPVFHLENQVIDFANSIKADFDIDLYANPYVEEIKC
ncbi:DUF4279 domain-containing protein [Bacillus nitratireducens]|uniref:DUF4279 domain-containing protein n=1 Tax=Bacillus nitratireducens TaxID=2026193 RepID=A0ABU6PF59_9BACI|nr:DUF4279 domain-containing protein [Bacillus nitratireducens]MDR4172329.1 DUF4279 domain-containing protein [Bacillus nitratireducens]MED4679930.1 DUF4279 domain-containing protein [Bacillus nitratireducens]PGW36909.1 hypothetical protein COE04_07825 [Bacillus cereus]